MTTLYLLKHFSVTFENLMNLVKQLLFVCLKFIDDSAGYLKVF